MSLFTIADLHLSLGTDKPMDVFHGWDNYVDRLTENWNKLITKEDTVVIGGDISWAMKLCDTESDFRYINSLPGKKIFLKGNHDYWWETLSKINRYIEEKNFDTINILFNNHYVVDDYVICGTRGWLVESESDDDKKILSRECGRLRLSLESVCDCSKEPVVFLHYPPVYANARSDEIIDILKEFGVKKCYYGHIHGTNMIKGAFNGELDGINFRLVSCDALKFTPLLVR
ncbi:MAG: metallophosphoesterase [Ruminococcus sp.]|jgi:predicted phosphohydrolase|nr:metallophosphoesterase [Ruminococcus sp.]